MIDQLNRLLAPLRRRLENMVARAIVRLTADETGVQELQLEVLKEELRDRCLRAQNYGFTSVPHAGAEAIVLFAGGHRGNPIVIAVDDRRYRMKNLAPGEVAIYTDEGDYVHFKRGREIKAVAGEKVTVETKVADVTATTSATVTSPTVTAIASTKVRLQTPLVEATVNMTVGGTLQVGGLITGSGGLAVSGGGGAVVTGDIEVSGDVADASGTMQEMRTTYNGHTHPENGTGGGTTSAPDQPMT